MAFHKNIVAINKSLSEEIEKILENININFYSNEDLANGLHVDPFNAPIDNCNYYILISKIDISRIKNYQRLRYSIGKKKLITINELNKIKIPTSFNEFVVQFYDFKDENKIKTSKIIYPNDVEITIISNHINTESIIRELASDYYKRCFSHFKKNVFYFITPVINCSIKIESEWKFHNKSKSLNLTEDYYYRIEKRLEKNPNSIFITDVIELTKYVIDKFNKKGIKELLVQPPLNEIDNTISMDNIVFENDNNYYDGWQELGNEEMARWDEETGGTWRIENDFG